MTCIVGLVENDGRVVMGGDSAGCSGWELTVRADTKVFENGPFLFGFTNSFRMGQLLRYAFHPPDRSDDVAPYRFMVTTFVDAVRACLSMGGFARKENEAESGGTFLVGYQGALYCIQSDYQVAQAADEFAAVGCGAQIALGALYANRGKPTEERVLEALRAAERFSNGVRAPFAIKVLARPESA